MIQLFIRILLILIVPACTIEVTHQVPHRDHKQEDRSAPSQQPIPEETAPAAVPEIAPAPQEEPTEPAIHTITLGDPIDWIARVIIVVGAPGAYEMLDQEYPGSHIIDATAQEPVMDWLVAAAYPGAACNSQTLPSETIDWSAPLIVVSGPDSGPSWGCGGWRALHAAIRPGDEWYDSTDLADADVDDGPDRIWPWDGSPIIGLPSRDEPVYSDLVVCASDGKEYEILESYRSGDTVEIALDSGVEVDAVEDSEHGLLTVL